MNNTWKIYILSLISFFVGTSQFGIVGMLDKIAASIDVPVSTAGQLITAFALGNAIGAPIVIVAVSKWSLRKQLLLALAIIFSGIVSTLVTTEFLPLMAARVLLGIGTGVFVVTAYAASAKLASPGKQGSAMANVALGFSSSLVMGVPIGRVIASTYDWKTIFWIIGILSIGALFAVAKMIPDMESEDSVPLSQRLALLKSPQLALMLCVTFFVFLGFSVIDTYITPYLAAILPQTEHGISAILFALGIGSVVGSKFGGLLADRIGTFRTLLGAMSVQMIALLLLSADFNSILISIPLLMIWVIACWTFGPTQNFNLVSLVPGASSIVLSLNSSFVQLGFAAGAGIGGMAVGGISVTSITWISAISAACALLLFISLHLFIHKKSIIES
ncbi:MFS transporter [Planococcus citreus]|uniref:DHA1 family putative efflux transporter-like MFS transporter n=1 Tax=Planococcus citreus TaxID=1373 RepID=A0A497YIM6_9BACL|nr:MFS transporter [Planococcus citreus]RLJ86997.1 DHA1 family putative efflux transporter-like MFS transporter [Planococcus citreus]